MNEKINKTLKPTLKKSLLNFYSRKTARFALIFMLFIKASCVFLVYRYSSSKKGSTGLVMVQDVPKVNGSRTDFRPYRLARGADELEASRRRWQTWNRSPDGESSATHDGERTVRQSLVNSHRIVEACSILFVMPAQPVYS